MASSAPRTGRVRLGSPWSTEEQDLGKFLGIKELYNLALKAWSTRMG